MQALISRPRHGVRLGARRVAATLSLVLLAACAAPPEAPLVENLIGGVPASQIVPGYGLLEDDGYELPPVPPAYLQGVNRRREVTYTGTASPGTIEIDPYAKFLYLVEEGGMAIRYPIAVGREGAGISGSFGVNRKAEWPGWTPTANMLRREPDVYGRFAGGVPGGLSSPLGARALYLYRGGRDSFYRIHGTNDLSSIGNSGSAGCIRLFNHDVIDLYSRVPSGARVVIRSHDESIRIEGPLMAERGIQLPAYHAEEGGQRPPVPQAMVPEEFYGNPGAQGGVGYVPDASDLYDERGPLAPLPASAPLGVLPDGTLGAVVPATSGVEMVGAGYAPFPT